MAMEPSGHRGRAGEAEAAPQASVIGHAENAISGAAVLWEVEPAPNTVRFSHIQRLRDTTS